MSKSKIYLYLILSGVLLALAWIPGLTGLFLFVAFIPLLLIEDYLDSNRHKYHSVSSFYYSSVTFLTWNVVATWWVFNASLIGMIVAFIVNTFLMSIVFWAFHFTKRKLGKEIGYISFIVYWIVFEHFYLHAEITWPWLTLGYGLANNIRLIQWYEYTGSLGGSLWVLIINVLLLMQIHDWLKFDKKKINWLLGTFTILLIVAPVVFSFIGFYTYKETGKPCNIVVIQPNIDPYEKFVAIESSEQTKILIDLAKSKASDSIDYFVAPETAINNNIWIDKIEQVQDIQSIREFLRNYPKAKYIVGITCYQDYPDQATPTARELGNTGRYYDSFNSAIQLDSTKTIQIYHKSMLVTGVEKMPYPQYLGFLKKLTVQLGGTFRSHGTQKERANLISSQDSTSVSPVICWESVFGEYVTGYIKKGSDFIFIITNDGWWGNTPGHKHHNAYASLRAIESRRSIARSANTGISSFVNQRGEILQELTWWKRGALVQTLHANQELTFYVKHGDYIASFMRIMALLIVITLLVKILIGSFKGKTQ